MPYCNVQIVDLPIYQVKSDFYVQHTQPGCPSARALT